MLRASLILCLLANVAAAASVESFTEPFRKIDLAPPEPGLIATLDVQEGDPVKQGQVLATLDSDLLRVSLEITKSAMEAHGRLQSANAERDLRRTRLERLKELHQRGHATQEEIARAQTDLAVTEANVLAEDERRAVEALEHKKIENMLERRVLRSPIEGVVSRVYKEEKEYVPANSPIVLTIVELDPLRMTFNVPTAQAMSLKVGENVPIIFSETGESATGRVELIAPVTEAESGTVRVKVLLDNPAGKYRCGVRCALELGGDDIGSAVDPLKRPLPSEAPVE